MVSVRPYRYSASLDYKAVSVKSRLNHGPNIRSDNFSTMSTDIYWDQLNQLASSIARFNIITKDVKDYCLQDTVCVWGNIRIFRFVAKMIPLSKHTVP